MSTLVTPNYIYFYSHFSNLNLDCFFLSIHHSHDLVYTVVYQFLTISDEDDHNSECNDYNIMFLNHISLYAVQFIQYL